MTVRMFQPPAVSAAHATLAQLFFSTVVAIAVFTSRMVAKRPCRNERSLERHAFDPLPSGALWPCFCS